ncbi:MAG: hypothetical protein J0I70_09180 [Microbacterium sp.]|uniref:hypothetical protein n=1 Tax=Microbacterium sp. TaxID=51671 RepID=UPI0009275C25|nr:hypothetical protein [Microbacterium sp.]MBN9174309.1 hypothetical protein [Microbacterium sp.]MBN9190921.1 hypothetical protein [Microbacterium sp.]MBN9193033.1 hypothetical protein [Microbacterium sp.]OJU61369.1 MAG: hypothetical protein BGO04_10765 [Microbacterium sp. 70-38]
MTEHDLEKNDTAVTSGTTEDDTASGGAPEEPDRDPRTHPMDRDEGDDTTDENGRPVDNPSGG